MKSRLSIVAALYPNGSNDQFTEGTETWLCIVTEILSPVSLCAEKMLSARLRSKDETV